MTDDEQAAAVIEGLSRRQCLRWFGVDPCKGTMRRLDTSKAHVTLLERHAGSALFECDFCHLTRLMDP